MAHFFDPGHCLAEGFKLSPTSRARFEMPLHFPLPLSSELATQKSDKVFSV